MPYDMPMSLEEVLADEEARRAAAAYLEGANAPLPSAAPQMPAPQAAQVAPDNFAALAQRYTEAQQRDRQQVRENALSQGAGNAAETILGGQGVRYARGPAPREPDEAGGVLRDARAQAEIAKLGRPPGMAAGKPAKSTDPSSPESKRGQDIIRANLSDQYTEEEIARMTEADVSDILKYGSMKRQAEVQREAEVGRGKRFTAQQMQQAQLHAENLGYKWADLDQEERLAWARIAESQSARDAAAAERSAKAERETNERNVGGFEIDPQNPPSADASKKMAEVSIQSTTLNQGLDALEGLYRKSGTELTGADSGVMAAEWKNLTDQLRNLSNMGVPNGKDYEMLAMQLENPTELRSLMTSKARGLAQMKTVREQVRRLVAATAQAYKFRTAGGSPQPTRTPGPKPSATTGKIIVTNGTETREIEAADLRDAEADGYRRVGQ